MKMKRRICSMGTAIVLCLVLMFMRKNFRSTKAPAHLTCLMQTVMTKQPDR